MSPVGGKAVDWAGSPGIYLMMQLTLEKVSDALVCICVVRFIRWFFIYGYSYTLRNVFHIAVHPKLHVNLFGVNRGKSNVLRL